MTQILIVGLGPGATRESAAGLKDLLRDQGIEAVIIGGCSSLAVIEKKETE